MSDDGKGRRDDRRPPRRRGTDDSSRRFSREGRPRPESDRKPRRDGDARPRRDGEERPRQEGGWKPRREGESRPRREGEWKPRREGDGRPRRDGERKPFADRGRGTSDRRPERPPLTEEERLARELKPVRPRHDDPPIPDDVSPKELDPSARGELRQLSKDNAEEVAKHLVMAARLIEEDPELAHRHAVSAARRAGRIAVVRETLAITAYAIGDFALALRELRTYRRISGRDDQIALMVDSERGVGRPDRALELGRSVDREKLPSDVQAALAIAMSGARLDQGQTELALAELQIPQLDPDTAYSYSPALFRAYGDVLEDLGRTAEAKEWHDRADAAEEALAEHANVHQHETVDVIEEELPLPASGERPGVSEPDREDGAAPEGEESGPEPESDARAGE